MRKARAGDHRVANSAEFADRPRKRCRTAGEAAGSLPVGPRRQSGRRGPGSYLDATHLLFQALAKRELPVASRSTLSPWTTAWDLLKPFLSLVTW